MSALNDKLIFSALAALVMYGAAYLSGYAAGPAESPQPRVTVSDPLADKQRPTKAGALPSAHSPKKLVLAFNTKLQVRVTRSTARSSTVRSSLVGGSTVGSSTVGTSRRVAIRSRLREARQSAIYDTFSPQRRVAADTATRAYFTLRINGVDKFEVLVLLRNGDVLIAESDLRSAGLRNFTAQTLTEAGSPYVSLQSLAPRITFAIDSRALALEITAPVQYLGDTVVDLGGGLGKRFPPSQNSSAFFNYAFDWRGFQTLREFSEIGISSHGNLYYSGFSIEPGGKVVRGLTNATFDNPALMKRWVIGDTFAGSGSLGGTTFLAGLSVSRNFGLNPYFVRYPGVGVSGSVLTPSTAAVYVNGQLVGVQQLAAGNFDIRNIPVVAGAGNTQVIIRDAFGHSESLNSPYYFSTALLNRGLNEYSYSLGARRFDGINTAPHYGSVVFSGHDNVGITDYFTAGARLEDGLGIASGGPSVALRFGSGQIGVAAGLSHAPGFGGSAGQFNYSYQSRRWGASGSYTALSDHYANLSLMPGDDRTTREVDVAAGTALGSRASLSVNYGAGVRRDAGPMQQASIAGAFQFTDRVNMIVTASRLHAAQSSANQFFLALNYSLGGNTLASLSTQAAGGEGSGAGFTLQRSLQAGNGLGYLITHGAGSAVRENDVIQYQNSTGLYGASYFQDGPQRAALELTAAGGIVSASDGLMFTRAVEDGFAVIDLPGLPRVRGYLNNQEIGRTDAKGRLFIPNLLSYYDNRVEISDQDIPLDYDIQSTEEIAVPSYRGGALVRFPVHRLSAISGTVIVDGARSSTIPAYGRLEATRNAETYTSDIGGQGEFYLDNITPGDYQAQVQYADGTCSFTLRIPQLNGAVTPLGKVECNLAQISGTTH